MVFLNDRFISTHDQGRRFYLPSQWVLANTLRLLPHEKVFVSIEKDKLLELLRRPSSLKEYFHELSQFTVKARCILGFYGLRTPRSASGYFEKVVRNPGVTQVVDFSTRKTREITLESKLADHISVLSGNFSKELYLQPRGSSFCIWDSGYYMDSPALQDSVDLQYVVNMYLRAQKAKQRRLAA